MADTPASLARKIEKWNGAGFDYSLVLGARDAMEKDRSESRARAPRRIGRLAGTIRVVQPKLAAAAKRGFVRIVLAAGSKSKANPVAYASVLQKGTVGYPPKPKTQPHVILAQTRGQVGEWVAAFGGRGARFRSFTRASGKLLRFELGGEAHFALKVRHPGSRFRARNYMAVDELRVQRSIDAALQRGLDRDMG
jgi:hypothetical protein